MDPSSTDPKAMTQKTEKDENIIVIHTMAMEKVGSKCDGFYMADSTGRMRLMPSKEYIIADSARGIF